MRALEHLSLAKKFYLSLVTKKIRFNNMLLKQQLYKITLLLMLGVIFVLGSCQPNANEENKKSESNLFVSGEIVGADNLVVTLEAMSEEGVVKVASSEVKAGEFLIDTIIPGIGIYQLRLGEQKENSILLTLKPGDHLKLNSSLNEFATNTKITGVSWGKAYSEYMKLAADFSVKQNDLFKNQSNLSQNELVEKYLELKKPMDDYARKYIDENPASPFNIVISNTLLPSIGFINYPKENIDALLKMAEAYEKAYPKSPITKNINEKAFQIDSGYKEYLMMKSGKKVAPDILLESPEGKQIKLSSLKGKVVLIDFWASWCKPCREANPHIVKLYHQYKNQGFTVYSVSLDTDKSSWINAIEQDALVWPNHVSDLIGWKSYVVKLYNFNAIPHTVLVGKDGNIIDVGLRGLALEDKLKTIFN